MKCKSCGWDRMIVPSPVSVVLTPPVVEWICKNCRSMLWLASALRDLKTAH